MRTTLLVLSFLAVGVSTVLFGIRGDLGEPTAVLFSGMCWLALAITLRWRAHGSKA